MPFTYDHEKLNCKLHTSAEGEDRSGRPISMPTFVNIDAFQEIILLDPRVELKQISEYIK